MTAPLLRTLLLGCALCAGSPGLRGASEDVPLRISQETCEPADVTLLDQDGAKVRLRSLLDTDEPVIVQFAYSSCTTICPVLCSGFAALQARGARVRLVSVTVDPDHDAPPVLKAYLKRFRARPGWDFLTGSREDIRRTLEGFNTYISSPASMAPITLVRPRKGDRWTRIFGLMSSSEFVAQCRRLGVA